MKGFEEKFGFSCVKKSSKKVNALCIVGRGRRKVIAGRSKFRLAPPSLIARGFVVRFC